MLKTDLETLKIHMEIRYFLLVSGPLNNFKSYEYFYFYTMSFNFVLNKWRDLIFEKFRVNLM